MQFGLAGLRGDYFRHLGHEGYGRGSPGIASPSLPGEVACLEGSGEDRLGGSAGRVEKEGKGTHPRGPSCRPSQSLHPLPSSRTPKGVATLHRGSQTDPLVRAVRKQRWEPGPVRTARSGPNRTPPALQGEAGACPQQHRG